MFLQEDRCDGVSLCLSTYGFKGLITFSGSEYGIQILAYIPRAGLGLYVTVCTQVSDPDTDLRTVLKG